MSAATILGPAPSDVTPTPTPTPTGPIGFQDVNSSDTGVWDIQKQSIHDEAVEHAVLCKHNDVDPLRAMLLNGFQGTLNTEPSKAIINRTRAAYRRVADPAFFRVYLEETKRRISEGCVSSETYCEEIRAIATSGFDAQTRADRVVERIFAEICNQVPNFLNRNVKMSASSEKFMEDLCATMNPIYNIQARTDRVVELLFGEIWRQVYGRQAVYGYATVDRQVMSELIEANIAVEERLQMGWDDKLLEQRFEMLGIKERVELDARIKELERELEILDMEVENNKKEKQQRDEMMRKAIKWLIFSTSQFMASFET